jgi:ATP-dependent DNA helicase RecG
LFAEQEGAAENERLQAFIATTNGFELAEKDFELRGPGELLGTRQHGLPPLRMADLRRDSPIVLEARANAQALVAADPELNAPEHALLRRQVLVRYGKALDLGDVG